MSASQEQPQCAVRFEAVPAELVELERWVLWNFEQRPGEPKPTKVPYQARRPHERASSTDAATWGSFEAALHEHCDGHSDGIGFVLVDEDDIVGIDLDDVLVDGIIEDSELATWVAALNSYVETSPSGAGLRILGRGELPPWSRNRRAAAVAFATVVVALDRCSRRRGFEHASKSACSAREVCTWVCSGRGTRLLPQKGWVFRGARRPLLMR